MKLRTFGAAAATLIVGAGGTFAADATVNPYDDKGTHYELPVKADIQQGERVEISKDEPKVDLVFWNDEERVSIKPLFPQTFSAAREEKIEANRPLLSKRMEFKKGDITAFVEPKDDDKFDVDFTLDAKPESNVFSYAIEGAEHFRFSFQAELTEDDIADGMRRPENVIGSYAVYHKTKANHRLGDTNYATGKAFHIYRPKAIDANGAEVWAQLHYSNGLLSVTVPQEFLDKATYPVVVDPTIGYTTQGASTLALPRRFVAQWHEMTENGDVSSISAYLAATACDTACDATSAIYEYTGDGDAGAFISNAATTTVSGAVALYTMNFSSPTSLSSGTKYYFTVKGEVGDVTLSGANIYVDTDGSSGRSFRRDAKDDFTGAGTYTSLSNVSEVKVEMWGGGGAGGGRTSNGGGGGGGGGAFASSTITISPSTGYAIGGGNVSGGTGNGSNGPNATFDTTVVVAAGGTGGSGGTGTAGGAGGTTAASTGQTEIAGATGGNGGGSGTGGGGGGEAACTNGTADAGNNGGVGTGGSAGTGCNGGDGGAGRGGSQGAGSAAGLRGGGGGGAWRTTTNQNGGAGGFSAAYVTYYLPGVFPSSFVSEQDTTATRNYSIYATYTASGGVAAPDDGVIFFD